MACEWRFVDEFNSPIHAIACGHVRPVAGDHAKNVSFVHSVGYIQLRCWLSPKFKNIAARRTSTVDGCAVPWPSVPCCAGDVMHHAMCWSKPIIYH